jgi:hypothetical protein
VEIRVDGLAIDDRRGVLLAATSLTVASGQVAAVRATPEEAVALTLGLTGIMKPSSGSVVVSEGALRQVAVAVDVPEVSAPEGGVSVRASAAEYLALSGRRSHRVATARWLGEHGFSQHASKRIDDLTGVERLGLLTALAASDPRVKIIVLCLPDRHSRDVTAWWDVAVRYAKEDYAVIAVCSEGTGELLPITAASVGSNEQPTPHVAKVS